jgi:hypothetical protein
VLVKNKKLRVEKGSVAKPGGYLSMSYVMLTIIHSDDRNE